MISGLRRTICFLIILFTCFVFGKEPFDPVKANSLLDKMTLRLSVQQLNENNFNSAVRELSTLRSQANQCIQTTEASLDTLNKTAQTTVPIGIESDLPSKYIEPKRQELQKRLANCKLFVFRATEAIDAFKITAQKLATVQLLESEHNVLKNLYALPNLFNILIHSFNTEIFKKQSGLSQITTQHLLQLLILIFSSILLGIVMRYKLNHYIDHKIPREKSPSVLQQGILCILKRYQIIAVILFSITAYFSFLSIGYVKTPILLQTCYAMLTYILYMSVIQFMFHPPEPGKPLLNFSLRIRLPLMFRLKLLGFSCLVAYLAYAIFQQQHIPESVVLLSRSAFITVVSSILISTLWLLNRSPLMLNRYNQLRIYMNIFMITFLAVIVFSDWLGYNRLSQYLLFSIIFTFLSVVVTWILHKILGMILTSLSGTEAKWQQKIRVQLGIKKSAPIPEFLWIKITAYTILWGTFLLVLLKIWRLSPLEFQFFIAAIFEGVSLANFTIIPSHVIGGIITFAVLVIITRWVRSHIARSEALFVKNQGARNAIATIMGYVGFSIAFIGALYTAGIELSGLAIIFGALSVGMGFGLQGIVNNFFSGLILLIERPINIGDRIIIKGVEGYVNKISIRSTQIRTLEYNYEIIPNADIIANNVTNFMFKNSVGRISVFVGVAYNSDLDLVRQSLLEAAYALDIVVPDKAEVLLKEFGDSAICFELRCFLKDINEKVRGASQLNFSIAAKFKENNIHIPFPQRDLHIKSTVAKEFPVI
jgi:small-conductance mechanosensitive channel